ncbi:MAG: hypothetical protein C5B50_17450 [Verrucomicrobia bacterium]|nr:MAG: hypothetical protein C5B50_17450 [Verrucomicrobiota bacterium]
MPQVLTTNALIVCPHGGIGKSVPTDPKWSVNDGPVLLDGDAGTLSCVFPVPCIGYNLKSMKLNATQVDRRNVMLVTDFTQSFTGFPLVITEMHQVYDDSTPTPIPNGGTVPATPPQLQENDTPTVTAAPPVLAFSQGAYSNTGQPVTLPMSFSLFSQFPNRWILTILSQPTNSYADITNGLLPNIAVAPAGGDWPNPALTVEVTLQGSFLFTLPIGNYYFVLAAINVRGLSSYAQVVLTITA